MEEITQERFDNNNSCKEHGFIFKDNLGEGNYIFEYFEGYQTLICVEEFLYYFTKNENECDFSITLRHYENKTILSYKL